MGSWNDKKQMKVENYPSIFLLFYARSKREIRDFFL